MTRVLHLAPPFGGGIATAARTISGLAPDHALATSLASGHELPDILHLHHALAWPEVAARLAITSKIETSPSVSISKKYTSISKTSRPTLVKTIHILQRRQNRLRGVPGTRSSALQDEALRHADHLTIATRAARDMLLEDLEDARDVLSPEDVAARLQLLPLPPPPRIPRSEHAASGPIVILGRFDTLKGTDLLIDALPRILKAAPHREVLIAGGLPDHKKAERRWLDALRYACPLTFTGWLSPDAVRETLTGAALFIAPSRLETCGLALMEALAASCPIVATDIPAHRELAQDAALLVPTDSASIAEGALALLSDMDSAERLGARGPDRLPDPAAVRAEWLHFWAETR